MIKALNIVLMVTSLLALIGVYALKYQTVDVANAKLALENSIEAQQSQLSLLKADWAYLNQPGRIEPIILRHAEALEIELISQDQFISLADVPMRAPAALNDEGLTELLQSLEAGIDPIAALIEASE